MAEEKRKGERLKKNTVEISFVVFSFGMKMRQNLKAKTN